MKFKLEIVIFVQFLFCFRSGGSVFGLGSIDVWGHHFRSTCIASSCKYMINNECIKLEEVEYGLLWFQDPTIYTDLRIS